MQRFLYFFLTVFFLVFPVWADRGRDVIGHVTVSVIHASNDEEEDNMKQFKMVDEETRARLIKDPRLKFTHYRQLGSDIKPLYRSYENWAQPLPPSDEILLRFEAQARPSKEVTRLDLELWLSRKKILKSGVALSVNTSMFVLGPEWRQGRMILIISLAPLASPVRYSAK
ncbi:MAG TPA: hypothetical protein DDW21_08380 [Verrucomicrobiales bacterium]|nr:MAG: hypothetical protein B9S37_08985 [Verrucomicrobiae bacterium Tous-C3TDCM]PAZ05123.1 MAG: hypothetical protein CAK88_08525 [Verrucomicrobiae bacterium AMD-G2]HBE23436.1 hypothetical protein [Verrucomicrobiales bacterium]